MQLAIDHFNSSVTRWFVQINKEKTVATLFTLSTKKEHTPSLKFGDSVLHFEDEVTYLGLIFDKRLTWKAQIRKAEGIAKRRLAAMRKLSGTKWGANMIIL